MQSHQSAFGDKVIMNQNKFHGHRRRPSLGKSMPVTSLLLNFPSPTQIRDYNSLSSDGLSLYSERPPKFFKIDEDTKSTNNDDNSSTDDNLEQDYEILLSDCSSSSEIDEKNEENVEEEETVALIGNSKFYTACLTCQRKKSLENNEELPKIENNQTSAIDELCEKLCDNSCKETFKDIEELNNDLKENQIISLKVPTKIEIQRKRFLTEMLQNDSDSGSEDNSNDKMFAIVSEIINKNTEITESSANKSENSMLKDFREKFTIAEALANTSLMTSPAAKRRIAARNVELELDNSEKTENSDILNDDHDFIPPRELLLYLVRMGSFNSAPKINNIDSQDDGLHIPKGLTARDLLKHFESLRGENQPQLLTRYFLKPTQSSQIVSDDITQGLRVLQLNSLSRVCNVPASPNQIRILQWNILSQSLGQNNDGFVQCPDAALTWEHRKFLIVQEILQNNPDIICLQEVDHFKFLKQILGTQNYDGIFFPKPDSPCLYIEENNGPDGCAIFFKRNKFELKNFDTRILEVWRVQSNQVAIIANLKLIESEMEICVCTTHLKARSGALLSKLRNEQGKDLLKFVKEFADNRAIIMCGDFNAEPNEPIYSTILNYSPLNLSSAYADIYDKLNKKSSSLTNENLEKSASELSAMREPPYTTWKIREDGEVCHTIDYIFYTKNLLKVSNCLQFPDDEEVGKNRTPSFQYPSDHFSLICDFEIMNDDDSKDDK